MPSLIDLRRRIKSVKNTRQITKAMKMMSAARLRRAQERVLAARPYASLMRQFLGRLVASLEASGTLDPEQPLHPLLARRPVERVLLLVMGGDKGLAGAFNANVFKSAASFLEEYNGKHIDLIPIGRKPRDFFRRRRALTAEFSDIFAKVKYEDARAITAQIIQRYTAGECDEVHVIYNEFKSVLVQRLRTERLLPLDTPKGEAPIDYIFEQPPAELLATLLPRYVEVQVFRALLESSASEHASRMTAMDAASKNASEMIDRLTLNMNRIRQASITREIIEIVSGAAALE
jgi:F-type H+-transporting ATPase subunit gamma